MDNNNNTETETIDYSQPMPALPMRDVVVLPRMVITLFVGRQLSLEALDNAMKQGGKVFLITQKQAEVEEPNISDLYNVGCVARVMQIMRMGDDSMRVMVEGLERARAEIAFTHSGGEGDGERERGGGGESNSRYLLADLTPLPMGDAPEERESIAMCRVLQKMVGFYAKVHRKLGGELVAKISGMTDLQRLTNNLIGAFPMPIVKRQEIFEMTDYKERVEALGRHISEETETQRLQQQIRRRVKKRVEKNHREYYLQEQARAIQDELGGDDQSKELEEFKTRIKKAGMPDAARKKCEQELKKLHMMPPMSAEATVSRSYLETLLSLPWKERSELRGDIGEAHKVLDSDHYGLEKIKEHILEYLAVQKRVANGKAPILCLVGPPGVGKTSLGKSIAKATGRVYGRIALGGVRDEAEIRGHRRTYIGAMPGKIANAMIRAEVKNPFILLDEIDKMGYDFRGDPSAALLEVLDPEQNHAFSDHYVEVDYDLSEVMFVTTANSMNIPPALQDRLEIIRLSGYTEQEKMHIASDHLVARQLKEAGLDEKEARFRPTALRDIVRYYTREAGVRSLERHIGRICRKIVLQEERKSKKEKKEIKGVKEGEAKAKKSTVVTPQSLDKYLGVRRYRFGVAGESKVGQVNGLAWTESGGDLLSVEACMFPGKGSITRTGKLGEVIRESVETGFSVVRARASTYNLPGDFVKKNDFHIHFPEGAIPKDGPSAGIAIATSILSVLSGVAVRADVAMTGEITLRGEVLPIGGVKEKLLAATRGDIRHVILPKENEKDMAEIPAAIKDNLKISFVHWIEEVFELAMAEPVVKKPATKGTAKGAAKKGVSAPKPEPKEKVVPTLPH